MKTITEEETFTCTVGEFNITYKLIKKTIGESTNQYIHIYKVGNEYHHSLIVNFDNIGDFISALKIITKDILAADLS